MTIKNKRKYDSDMRALYVKLATKYNLTSDEVKNIIQSPYEFSKKIIKELELEPEIEKDQFDQLKTNFIFPYLGKLYTNFYIYKKVNKVSNDKSKRK